MTSLLVENRFYEIGCLFEGDYLAKHLRVVVKARGSSHASYFQAEPIEIRKDLFLLSEICKMLLYMII